MPLLNGENRVLCQSALDAGQVIVNDGFARVGRTRWRGARVAIPVFSLRSEKSFWRRRILGPAAAGRLGPGPSA